ncbi:MAG TPA: Hsp20/alpha crystallin family protein [Chitinophagaceae bacterium]|nr:Hsp20/alpha crystallin family protein [Chitinophagaceae bacterium]
MMYNRVNRQAPVHFANLLEGFLNNEIAQHKALVNVRENENQYEVQVIAPGLHKEDFSINVEKDMLHIAFEQKKEAKETEDKWLRQEFRMPSFKRSFALNEKVDASGISAVYENGILSVGLPKKEKEEVKSVSISVQ